jgi:hypothetical protein
MNEAFMSYELGRVTAGVRISNHGIASRAQRHHGYQGQDHTNADDFQPGSRCRGGERHDVRLGEAGPL